MCIPFFFEQEKLLNTLFPGGVRGDGVNWTKKVQRFFNFLGQYFFLISSVFVL